MKNFFDFDDTGNPVYETIIFRSWLHMLKILRLIKEFRFQIREKNNQQITYQLPPK